MMRARRFREDAVVQVEASRACASDEQRARRSGRIGHLQTCAKASVAGVLLIAQTGGGVATVPCVTLIGRFRMGDVFPPDDPVARFVVTVAMFANDLFRSTRMFGQLGEDVHEARGRRLMLVRYQASVFYEISLFIADARRVPPVAEFIDSLPDEAATDAARMTESTRELDPWLRTHRNVTFHYPEMHPDRITAGRDEVMDALTKAADEVSHIQTIEAGEGAGFPFADEVVVQLLPDALREATSVLTSGVIAATSFSMAAARAYISAQPEEAFEVFDSP
jgi:hypothetical protein